jgi:hypothetical protein
VGAAQIAMHGKVHENIVGAQAFATAPLEIFLGAGEPMAIRPRGLELVQEEIGQKAAIDDCQRIVGEGGPQGRGQRHFPVGTSPDRQAREQVAAEDHQGDHAHLRVAGAAPAALRAAKGLVVLGAVRDAELRAIDAVDGEPAPAVLISGGGGPLDGRGGEQGGQGLVAEAVPGLDNGATGDVLPGRRRDAGQDQMEVAHHLRDRAIPQ